MREGAARPGPSGLSSKGRSASGLSRRAFVKACVKGVGAVAVVPLRRRKLETYTVTDPGDDQRDGQLRAGVEQRAAEIRFALETPIRLRGDLLLEYPGLVISGEGAPVCPEIDGMLVTRSKRIHLRDLAIHRTVESYTGREDCLRVSGGSVHVRASGCSFMGATDENVDVTEGPRGGGRPRQIEFVRCVFARPTGGLGFNPYNMLIGASTESVWIYGCLFANGRYRNPVSGADLTSFSHNVVFRSDARAATVFEGHRRSERQLANVVGNHYLASPINLGGRPIRVSPEAPVGLDAYVSGNTNYTGGSDPFMRDAVAAEFLREFPEQFGRVTPSGERALRRTPALDYVLRHAGPKHPVVSDVKQRVMDGTEAELFL